MLRTSPLILCLLPLLISACSEPTAPPKKTTNACGDISTCTIVGLSCDGRDIVSCAQDSAGCLVESRSTCERGCSTDSGAASCESDPCLGVTNCDTPGNACVGNSVVSCAADSNGCLVESQNSCESDEICESSDSAAYCTTDPCFGLALCDTAGTTCSGGDILTCAANLDGCFVNSVSACDGSLECADVAGTPACIETSCDGITDCIEPGNSCNANTLITCGPDAGGCLIQSETSCTADGNNFCDAAASGGAVCGFDSCLGEAVCNVGLSCAGDTLQSCTRDIDGCKVLATTDCTTEADGACDSTGNTPVCTTSNSGVCDGEATCTVGDTLCSTDTLITCELDSFGCKVETSEDCAVAVGGSCDDTGDAACIIDPCASKILCDVVSVAGTSCVDSTTLETCTVDTDGCMVQTLTTCAAEGTDFECTGVDPASCGLVNLNQCGGSVVATGAVSLAEPFIVSGTSFFTDFSNDVALSSSLGCWPSYSDETRTSIDGLAPETVIEVGLDARQSVHIFQFGAAKTVLNITEGQCSAASECESAGNDYDYTAMEALSISYEAPSATTAYVLVEADTNNATASDGDYDIEIFKTTCGNDVLEYEEYCDDGDADDADICTNTCIPQIGDALGFSYGFSQPDMESDSFILSVLGDTRVTGSLIANTGGDADIEASVLSIFGTQPLVRYDVSQEVGDETSLVLDLIAGVYAINVYGNATLDTGYTMTISGSALAIPSLGSYAAGEAIAARVSSAALVDTQNDFFQIEFTEAVILAGTVISDLSGDPDLEIFAPGPIMLGLYQEVGDESFTGLALSAGVYKIRVSAFLSTVDNYTLSLSTTAP